MFWFRRDLRLADNPALVEAAICGDAVVAPAFIVDPRFAAPAGPTRAAYLRATLEALDATLEGNLIVRNGDPSTELLALATEVGATCVLATRDHAPAGRRRDERVARALAHEGIEVRFVDSNYVVPPGAITTKSGSPCRVYGAYRRGWELVVPPTPLAVPNGIVWRGARSVGLDALTEIAGSVRPAYFGELPDDASGEQWSAGEVAAHERLELFATNASTYHAHRDSPGEDATSRLSPFLRFGALHPRQVMAALSNTPGRDRSFETELCWRDFYADVLFHYPESISSVLQPSMSSLRVDRDAAAVDRFQTWARGETGYPLVDAGMRQLLSEGWMHNRVRMVAASFLVKHLHLDWRWGAKWFMWRLIDGDIASNQHGWQWTAGTGTDAAPFHRIFNPSLQAQRFDPDGVYVRRHVPELASLSAPQCLMPGGGDGLFAHESYPAPMVDLNRERLEALSRFKEARSG
ncbi:MAG: deoxyribodipyrimidine photo-lyase [Acidobacteria bacterium]|nr:deoxyribodipyrimidine photo-lyase [Acidobacteriota bacterium]